MGRQISTATGGSQIVLVAFGVDVVDRAGCRNGRVSFAHGVLGDCADVGYAVADATIVTTLN